MLRANGILFFILFFCVPAVYAAGPEKIAYFDRALWPESIADSQSFDRASRFEIYHFSEALSALDYSDKKTIAEFTGVKSPDLESVSVWVKTVTKRLLESYSLSCANQDSIKTGCSKSESLSDLRDNMSVAYKDLDASYDRWKSSSILFHKRYLYEQVRLAALFPRVSSEILTFSDKELTGFEFKDREFLLSFDDGPSRNVSTDNIIAALNDLKVNAMFFLLGERLNKHGRGASLRDLYAGQCVASHGFIHKAHPRLETWKNSIDKTNALIVDTLGVDAKGIWFRPPYGQRTGEIGNYLYDSSEGRIMLWNIDSQDWNKKINADSESSRVITLMLLWRKGVVLFHDLYKKNVDVLKTISSFAHQSELSFEDCGRFAEIVKPVKVR